jgi:hypothetical protein
VLTGGLTLIGKSFAKAISLGLVLCLAMQLFGCEASSGGNGNSGGSATATPGGSILVGNDQHGYLEVADDWHRISGDNDWFSYISPTGDSSLSISVEKDASLEEVLYNARETGSYYAVEDFLETTITLDEGKVNPVYRFSFLQKNQNLYHVTYRFEGFDGLVRSIFISSLDKGMVLHAASLLELSYSFNCEPDAIEHVDISRTNRQLVLEHNGVSVTLLGYYQADPAGSKITLKIENYSDVGIKIKLDTLLIVGEASAILTVNIPEYLDSNGAMLAIAAGQTLICSYYVAPAFLASFIDGATINEIGAIELSFTIRHPANDELIYQSSEPYRVELR